SLDGFLADAEQSLEVLRRKWAICGQERGAEQPPDVAAGSVLIGSDGFQRPNGHASCPQASVTVSRRALVDGDRGLCGRFRLPSWSSCHSLHSSTSNSGSSTSTASACALVRPTRAWMETR